MARGVLGLRDRGHSVSVFTLSPQATRLESHYGPGLALHIAPYRATGRAKDIFRVERRGLESLMHDHPQDVLHAHWTYEFALAALKVSRRVVVTAHDSPLDILRLHPHPYRLIRGGMAALVARKAPVMTAVSPYIVQRFASTFRRRDLRLVANGVPDEIFKLQAERPGSFDQITFASSMMGFGGRKNGAALLRAFARLRLSLPGSRLLMFGAGYESQGEAERYAQALNIEEGITFVGPTPYDVLFKRMANEVDILVHPSLEESFGMAITEAMGLGLPVIAGARSGAVPWVTGGGRVARLVDVSSVDALAVGMLEMAQSPGQRDYLARVGRAYVSENFSLNSQLTGYETAYAEVIPK